MESHILKRNKAAVCLNKPKGFSMSRISFKYKLPILLLVPVLILSSVLLFASGKDQKKFDSFTRRLFQQELCGNTLNMHYTVANPEKYGIVNYEPTLACYSKAADAKSREDLKEYLQTLSSIDPEKLDEDSAYAWLLLSRSLALSDEGSRFLYYEEPLSPSSGMQSQLPILLAEYTFRSQKDVEDYLSLLAQTDAYFSSLLVYEQEKKAAGLLQADTSLEKVAAQCCTILTKEELAAGSHFLQTTFRERIAALVTAKSITRKEADAYIEENNRILQSVLLPAYEKLAGGLLQLCSGDGNTPHSLSVFPEGRAYYAWLVRRESGTSMSMDEMKILLYTKYEDAYRNLQMLLTGRTDAYALWTAALSEDSFPLKDSGDMLSDLQMRMQTQFPAFPQAAHSTPSAVVKSVSPSLQDYCAPAFYLTPPLDDTDNNVIYINEKSTPNGLELYTTLAHEGYPGHLYQTVYSQLTMRRTGTGAVRQLLWYGGYQEGWAVYVENLSYEYAVSLLTEKGNSALSYGYQLEQANRELQLCLSALLDFAIHYDGATYEQVSRLLHSIGIADEETIRSVYDYIAEEPANYIKYYIGYLEILRLKETARELWQDDYSDLRFHTFLLSNGPADFQTLRELLMQKRTDLTNLSIRSILCLNLPEGMTMCEFGKSDLAWII